MYTISKYLICTYEIMKYLNGLFEKFKKSTDLSLNNSFQMKDTTSTLVSVLQEEREDADQKIENGEIESGIKKHKKKKSKKNQKKPSSIRKFEHEYDEFVEEDDWSDEYRNQYNFEKSLFNQITLDPVLRYALENWEWEFLYTIKYGEMADEYELMKQEMIDNWSTEINFDGSLLQKISENYVYFVALEKLEVRFLDKLRNGTLLYNDYKKFAEDNNIDIIIWSLWSKKYHDFILGKNFFHRNFFWLLCVCYVSISFIRW